MVKGVGGSEEGDAGAVLEAAAAAEPLHVAAEPLLAASAVEEATKLEVKVDAVLRVRVAVHVAVKV